MLPVWLHPIRDRKCLRNTVKSPSKVTRPEGRKDSTHVMLQAFEMVAGPPGGAGPLSPRLRLLLLIHEGLPGL